MRSRSRCQFAVQISESSSGLFGGVALDDLGLNIRQVGFIMAGGGALMSLIWMPYAIYRFIVYRRKVKASASEEPGTP